MNIADIVILLVIAGILFLGFYGVRKRKSGCCGECSSCGMCPQTGAKDVRDRARIEKNRV